jgi:hypothetical protein
MDKIPVRPVKWLWPDLSGGLEGRIPREMLTILAGRRQQRKGLFCALLAAHVSTSRYPAKGGGMRPGHVLYSAAEDSDALMTRPRLMAVGADLRNIESWRFTLPKMHGELEKHLKAKETDLIIMDPVASHLSDGIQRYSDSIRKATDPLTELIEELGTIQPAGGPTALFVEHVLKRVTSTMDPLDAIGGGSSGLIAAARMAFLMGIDPDNDERSILYNAKYSICDKRPEIEFTLDTENYDVIGDVPLLLQGPEVTFDPVKFLTIRRGGRQGRPPHRTAAAVAWLQAYLYDRVKGQRSAALFEDGGQLGFSKKVLRSAAMQMNSAGHVGIVKTPPGGGPNVVWTLGDKLRKLLDKQARAVPQFGGGEAGA